MKKDQKISDHKWELESVTDVHGQPLDSEMTLVFNTDNSFLLTDQSEGQVWKGNYRTEKGHKDYKLELDYENKEEVVVGTYGTREYEDKTTIPSIIMPFQEKILSFIASE